MTNNQWTPQQLPVKPVSIHITRIKSNACYFRKQKRDWDKPILKTEKPVEFYHQVNFYWFFGTKILKDTQPLAIL